MTFIIRKIGNRITVKIQLHPHFAMVLTAMVYGAVPMMA
jgi:hypothetical protein